jgi:hypothetical protein
MQLISGWDDLLWVLLATTPGFAIAASWEPEWLDAEVDRNELRPELEALAEARGAAR